MPIKSPDQINELRITLGRKEFQELKEAQKTARQNVWLDAIPNIGIGAVGVGAVMAGLAVFSWAGLTVASVVDSAKRTFAKNVTQSTWGKGFFEWATGQDPDSETELQRMILAWRDRIYEIRARMEVLEQQRQTLQDLGLMTLPSGGFTPQYRGIIDELISLSNEETELYAKIDRATKGYYHWTGDIFQYPENQPNWKGEDEESQRAQDFEEVPGRYG